MDIRKIILAVMILTGSAASVSGQGKEELKKTYSDRYDLVVSKLGPDGVGIETILDQWAAVDSLDTKMLAARFSYYFAKSQSTSVVVKPEKKYLGADPVLSLKDSTGADVYYFQEVFYDDSLFSMSMKSIDKAIAVSPQRIDFRFSKAAALLSYEKDSPDMTLSFLLGLVEEDAGGMEWEYPGYELDDDFFKSSMQEYCYAFFKLGTPSSYEAFRTLSERMLMADPDDPQFISNLGSYCLVVSKDYGKALKYYKKTLKINPQDYTTLKNCVLLARQQKNRKLEKKYLTLFMEVAPENEKLAAEARLEFLSGK